MIDKVFIDTNIIVYGFDSSEKQKQARINELIKKIDNDLFISVQVLNEFINIASRKLQNPIPLNELKTIIVHFKKNYIITPITYDNTNKAIDISLKYKYSFWDSLIIASALEMKCSILYSEDLKHNQLIENQLRILNPFKLQ